MFSGFVLIILSPFFLDGHHIEESAKTKKKKSRKTTGFIFLLQILIRLLSMWLMNVSVSLHLLRHFKLRSDTSSWDHRIHPRMGHSSPRLQTSYYWPAISQALLISSKFVSLEEKNPVVLYYSKSKMSWPRNKEQFNWLTKNDIR